MAEHVTRNLQLTTMRPDDEIARSSNLNYNNFNSNLRLYPLFVSIDFIDLELDTGIINMAPGIDLIDLDSEVKATRGPFIDPEDRWDITRTFASYLDLIDLRPGIETADLNSNSSLQADKANSIVLRPDLIELESDADFIAVNMDLVNFTMCTAIIRHTDSDSSGLSTNSNSVNTFGLDLKDGTMYLNEWNSPESNKTMSVATSSANTARATRGTSQSGASSVGSLPSGTDDWSPAFADELIARLDALAKLPEEQLQ